MNELNEQIGVLPVKAGCTCRARIRIFTYLARLELQNCELNQNLCFVENKACGSPRISTDIYLRGRPSTVKIGITNISLTGFTPSNTTGQFLNISMFIPTSFDITLTGTAQLAAPPITLADCEVTVGGKNCTQCDPCSVTQPFPLRSYKGFRVNCDNVQIGEATFFNNATPFKVYVPNTNDTCIEVPLVL
jgi:hypothetical protein